MVHPLFFCIVSWLLFGVVYLVSCFCSLLALYLILYSFNTNLRTQDDQICVDY